jgi:DNA helicase HerA-like ATPase
MCPQSGLNVLAARPLNVDAAARLGSRDDQRACIYQQRQHRILTKYWGHTIFVVGVYTMSNHEMRNSPSDEDKLDELRGDYQGVIDQLEAQAASGVKPLAYSTNGRTFGYSAPLSLPIPPGCYVRVDAGDQGCFLGQIISKEIMTREGAELGVNIGEEHRDFLPDGMSFSSLNARLQFRLLEGTGVLLGKVGENGFTPTANTDTFQRAGIALADAEMVSRYLASASSKEASLPIGQALYVDGHAAVRLNAGGFNRHTFLCGQSGSGKTFALGIILEQLLLETDLRMVVIDPNSDFISLNQLRTLDEVNQLRSTPLSEETYTQVSKRYEQAANDLRVFRPITLSDSPENNLCVRFSDLSRDEQSGVLELDPLTDREEYNIFWRIVDRLERQDYSLADVQDMISHDYTSEARQLGLRIENKGVANWDVWSSPASSSLVDTLKEDDWRCLVLDIGTLDSMAEKTVIGNAVLTHFWRHRNQRKPVLVVIDEAHNICPQDPLSDMQAVSTEEVIRIAGEGRKFGIYLLLATQRPGKIHNNVLSQCENLALMRMNSSADLKHLADILSQVPRSLMNQATTFKQGESLLTGRIVLNHTFAQFEGRVSVEGGSDIPASWAAARD